MANLLPPTDGIIICTNLTCVIPDGKVREPDLVWMLLYSLSLNSEVYIHRNDIIDGNYASYVDGVRVNFTPQIVSKKELQEASETGVRKRSYDGRVVSIAPLVAENTTTPTHENIAEGQVVENDSNPEIPTTTENVKVKSQEKEEVPVIPTRIKIFPEGDSSIRSTGINFHQKDIQTFGEDGKLAPSTIRLRSAQKFTLMDLMSNKVLTSDGKKANNVFVFQWDTPAEGIQTIGFKFSGAREISLSLVELTTGENIDFRLTKV